MCNQDLQKLLGCQLLSAQALIYVYNEEENLISPQALLLSFESETQVRLRCDSIGKPLENLMLVKSREFCLLGLQFSFENNLSVIVINLGDELFVFESLSEKIELEERIYYEKIR